MPAASSLLPYYSEPFSTHARTLMIRGNGQSYSILSILSLMYPIFIYLILQYPSLAERDQQQPPQQHTSRIVHRASHRTQPSHARASPPSRSQRMTTAKKMASVVTSTAMTTRQSSALALARRLSSEADVLAIMIIMMPSRSSHDPYFLPPHTCTRSSTACFSSLAVIIYYLERERERQWYRSGGYL